MKVKEESEKAGLKLSIEKLRTWHLILSDQIRSDQLLSSVWLFATPWLAAHQVSLSITNSRSSPRLTSIESVMTSSHLILCRPLLLLPPIPRLAMINYVLRSFNRVYSDSCPSSQWWHPAISSSVCPQSLPASESCPMSQLFAWGGQSTGVSALASFLPKKSQDCPNLLWYLWGVLFVVFFLRFRIRSIFGNSNTF